MNKNLKKAGFTLIELIIVVAIIALLASAGFVAINPGKRSGDANNAKRWADVTAIADAYSAYLVDNGGVHPTTTPTPTAGVTYSITTTTAASGNLTICEGGANATTTTQYIDLEALVSNGYIGKIPLDPTYGAGDSRNSGYYFYRESSGTLVIGSCDSYNNEDIELVR